MSIARSNTMQAMSSPVVRIGLGVVVSALALYLAANNAEADAVLSAFVGAHIGWVLVALAALAVNVWAKAARWQVLVGASGAHIPASTYLSVLLIGQMLNTLLPARVGEISRAYTLGGMGPGRVFVFGTIVIEKFLDLLAYGMLFLVLLLLMPLPDWLGQSPLVLTLMGGSVFAGLLLLAMFREPCLALLQRLLGWLPAHWQGRLLSFLETGLASLDVFKRRGDLLRLTGWTGLVWVTAVLINYLTLHALHIVLGAPWTVSLLLLIVLQAGIALPISLPGKIGIFESICVFVLAFFGVSESLGLTYGLLLHAIVLVPPTLLGLVCFWLLGLSGETIAAQRRAYEHDQRVPESQP